MILTQVKAVIPEPVSAYIGPFIEAVFRKWKTQATSAGLMRVMDLPCDTPETPYAVNMGCNRFACRKTSFELTTVGIILKAVVTTSFLTAGSLNFLACRLIEKPKTDSAQILPGTDKAVLTLADGSCVSLGAGKGDSSIFMGAQLIRLDSDAVNYVDDFTDSYQPAFHVLSTPRGGQFQVGLPDGSHIWLNAASSLRYPVSFQTHDRIVELTGQAFFDVAPATRPFIVKTGSVDVQVLGNCVDIMCYPEEGPVKTSLLSGEAIVTKGHVRQKLTPGDQAMLSQDSAMFIISHPAMEEVIAWKEGDFLFKKARVDVIMRQLSRWYDVAIRYEGPAPMTAYTGTFSRKEDVTRSLQALEIAGVVHYKIEGKTVIITRAGSAGPP